MAKCKQPSVLTRTFVFIQPDALRSAIRCNEWDILYPLNLDLVTLFNKIRNHIIKSLHGSLVYNQIEFLDFSVKRLLSGEPKRLFLSFVVVLLHFILLPDQTGFRKNLDFNTKTTLVPSV